jgi:hypothetical protein
MIQYIVRVYLYKRIILDDDCIFNKASSWIRLTVRIRVSTTRHSTLTKIKTVEIPAKKKHNEKGYP